MLHFHRFLEHGIENNGNIFEDVVPEFLEQLDGFSARDDQSKTFIRMKIEDLQNKETDIRKLMWVFS